MTISSTSFNDRLTRIEKISAKNKGRVVLHVGDREMNVRADSAMLRGAIAEPRTKRRLLAFIPALGTGVAGFVLASVLREHFMTPQIAEAIGTHADLALFGAALLVAFVIGLFFKLLSTKLVMLQALGVVIAMAGLHNLAFWQPALASSVFSEAWVQQKVAETEPRTLTYAGAVIHF
ncbi:MAG: hypothetical protein H5U24_00145 [Thioclava marina]|jgi:hypothetical protein|uniref:Uncharacterized protein n=1 Tax=Thioclava marina TaxID=1915077 RepID=A0ABX3MM98_9RHOB|nr:MULTISPECIES: hypothetical protein [Thioclava]TNE83792.1 MAG: hypothetical protein EP337_14790 [Paracoccaceae bacterium]MBC7143794.1 hypothetical protein [Thioclava marina]MBD3802658.1 hypothetical protein [Thioclava sp.]OOY12360.1 hypothetical protein BMG00_00370 [Thioclava marina]OOY28321.1 hypothetical protein BMI90_06435 [Thioclava sp. L04-15]